MSGQSNYIHTYPEGTKIAFDVNIADRIMGAYARSGCIIVYVAKDAEEDEVWINKALSLGATVLISSDLDVPNYLDRRELNQIEWREP